MASLAIRTSGLASGLAALCLSFGCEEVPELQRDAGTLTGSVIQPPGLGDGGRRNTTGSGTDSDSRSRSMGGLKKTEPAPEPPPGGCAPDGAMRCGKGSGERERCISGAWTADEPCPEGQGCTQMEGQAVACRDVEAVCQGSPGETICADGVIYTCSESAVADSMESCASARHCQLGRPSGTCAACVPDTEDEFICNGKELQRCTSDGSGYEAFKACETEALCNVVAGDCTDSACLKGQMLCDGDTLMRCADDLSKLEMVSECEAGLCDATAGVCDACLPGTATCDGNTSVTCKEDGSELVRTECPEDTPICVGNGRCVQCGSAEDCGEAASCKVANCDFASGECRPTSSAAKAQCAGGLCDGEGTCVQCLDASDCPEVGDCQVRHCNTGTARCEPKPAPANTPCGNDGRCDAEGQCDSCTPGERSCTGNWVSTCDPDGQGTSTSRCPSGTMCTGPGECVECVTDGDCSDLTTGCSVGVCDDDKCVEGDATNGTQCTTRGGQDGSCSRGSCVCTPKCNANDPCGSDGCGNSCGTCASNQTCQRGSCECKANSCGGSCGSCPSPQTCSGGTCSCPSNSCGGPCGSCPSPQRCSGGTCSCPSNACGGACGSCPSPQRCSGGTCSCPSDACGGACGSCPSPQACISGSCQCGSNSCGGPCGACASDEECANSRCRKRCGNGRRDSGEECDDGNTLDLDSCTSDCENNTAYNACGVDSDCHGDLVCAHGVCTQACPEQWTRNPCRTLRNPHDQGSDCYPADNETGSACFPRCSSDSDCPFGLFCSPLSLCFPFLAE